MEHRNGFTRILFGVLHLVFGRLLIKGICDLNDLYVGEVAPQNAMRHLCDAKPLALKAMEGIVTFAQADVM